MVFADLSQHSNVEANDGSETSSFSTQGSRRGLNPAPVNDRFLAVAFDFVFFSPIFTLILSPLIRSLEKFYLSDPQGLEYRAIFGLILLGVLALSVLTQGTFLWRFGATPGKMIFKLKVRTLSGESLSLAASLVRSSVWVFEVLCLGLPFLEVFSHPHRRALHDRAAETQVFSNKRIVIKPPHPLEVRLVRNTFWTVLTMLSIWTLVFAGQIFNMSKHGEFRRSQLEEDEYFCPQISAKQIGDEDRLDFAIAQFATSELSEDCLTSEANFGLWSQDLELNRWGYLAKAIMNSGDKGKALEYLNQVCASGKVAQDGSEPCQLAQALKLDSAQRRTQGFKPLSSLTATILLVKELTNEGRYDLALKKIRALNQRSPNFEKYAQRQTVKLLWALGKQSEAEGAYANSWSFLNSEDQMELSAWMCLEQVDRSCENKNYPACNDLKVNLQEHSYSGASSEALIGLVHESECKHKVEVPLYSFNDLLSQDSALNELVMALSSESKLSEELRKASLQRLSFETSTNASPLVQRRAQLALLDRQASESDELLLFEVLQKYPSHDWAWQSVMRKLKNLSEQKGQEKLLAAFNSSRNELSAERRPASHHETTDQVDP